MKKSLISLCLAALIGIVVVGCSQQQGDLPDILQIVSVTPAQDATDVATDEALVVVFNFSIDNAAITKSNFFSEYAEMVSGTHTAGTPEIESLQWSEDGKTLTIRITNWSNYGQGADNNQVAIRATNRIKDVFGNVMHSAPILWRFRLRYLAPPKTDPPTFVLSPGSYESNSVLVTIEAPDADAIYYTLDGSTPTAMSTGTLYTGPITLESSKTIKAIATRAGSSESDVSTAWYDLYWWQALGSGPDDAIYALAYDPDNGILYAGGRFTLIGSASNVHHVAQWNGSAWSAMDGGVEGTGPEVNTLLYSNGHLYVGGSFLTADTTTVNGIASWNGSSWSALGSGVSGGFDVVFALANDSSNNLIAGGDYTSPANHIAKWNGSAWSAFSPEPNNRVDLLAFNPDNNILYASGWFNNIGKNNIAQWTGTTWEALGNGITKESVPADIFAMAAGSNLYVGGDFDYAGTASVNNIAMWDGASWSALGSGTNDSIYGMTYDSARNILYVGGKFSSPASLLAKWDGLSWSSIPGSITGNSVWGMTVDPEGNLYIFGDFTQAGGVSTNQIAKWGKK